MHSRLRKSLRRRPKRVPRGKFAESGGEEDEIMLAAGFGMVAGIMYAGIMYARNDLTDSKERKPVSS